MDRRLDPATGDFVAAAAGGFQACDDIENQIAFSYMIARGSWEGDPTLGHRFEELARATNTVENRSRLKDLAREAVRWLLDLGLLERVEIDAESVRGDAVAFQVDYYVPGSDKPKIAGPFLIPVGAG